MGYLRITRPDGTEILFDEDDEITIYEVCDTCNNKKQEQVQEARSKKQEARTTRTRLS